MTRDTSAARFDLSEALQELGSEQACSGQPDGLFALFDRICQDRFGHRLFTLLAWAPETNDVERLYSSRPADYPLLGRKAMGPTQWGAKVLKGGETWLGRDAADIRWAFPDHELILSLGCEACLNTPVLYDGRVLGVVSVLGPEGAYDHADLEALVRLTPALVPAFLAAGH